MNVIQELRRRFRPVLEEIASPPDKYLDMVRPTQDPKFGDFQANFAMPLKQATGRNPREIAAEIVERVELDEICLPCEVAGPGFINLRLKDEWIEQRLAEMVGDDRLGVRPSESPRRIVVDFSAPNVAKPMHVGHLRSSVIGDAICRVLRFLGHDVTSDNHIGDWGTQFGMIIYGFKNFRDQQAYETAPVDELARLYRLVNQVIGVQTARDTLPRLEQQIVEKTVELDALAETQVEKAQKKQHARDVQKRRDEIADLREEVTSAERKLRSVETDALLSQLVEEHPRMAELARRETAKLHVGDAENLALWQEFMPACLTALQRLYDRLKIQFDETLGESHYQPMLADVVSDLQARGIAVESDGAICVFLDDKEAPFIIRKQDGAFTYATTDLATIRTRLERWKADEILYVVDTRQGDHFHMLFATAAKSGMQDVALRHIKFGTILGDDKRPFKTRSGDTVGLESLLDEAVARARIVVDENDPQQELDPAAKDRIAEIVGIGGIKYADLRHNRESDYVFSWEKMLAKTGDTATYIQYAFARVNGICRKAGVAPVALRGDGGTIRLAAPEERALGLQLLRYAEALDDVAYDYRPNILTQYLFDTANRFSSFYNECPVASEADAAVRTSRLLLCDMTARVLQHGLGLLGIETADRM